nr:dynein heavy chain 2, axonemal isoform X2 [Nomia melanderi]
MSSKKEQKSDTTKKSDKMIDTHREFLDMDTDEEDYGRQESPELEEELPPEPEKPVFAEEDLSKLVKYVKHLTIFSDASNGNWNENCDEVIQEYFENPSHELLTVFHQGNKLTAILNFPKYAPKGFMYFLRSPWQIYTVDNFLDTVLFGSITGNIRNSIFKFMETVYAPILLRSNEYTSFIKDETFSNLHEFIIRFTEEIYKPKGLTTLYVPKENLKAFSEPSNKIDCFLLGEDQKAILPEEDERKRKLVRRLEKIVWSWIVQIHRITVTSPNRKKIECIQDEVNYWKLKHSNLNYLRTQFLNPEVRFICDVLRNFRSLNVHKFEELAKHIEEEIQQVASNLMYLNVMLDFCKDLNIPEDAENSVTKALLLILFIWMEAPFYSTANNIETLCESFSWQIIRQCRSYIQLDAIFGSDPEEGKKMLEKCIFCCNIYKTVYHNLTTNVVSRINPDRKWEINEDNVFNKIDTFKGRCYSMIEICEALAIFGRHHKIGSLGSPRGVEYEAYWQEIENSFYENLNELSVARDVIFDMTKSSWLKKVGRFKCMIQQLENMVINLINDIFKNVENIEEGIEAIYALQKFKKREIFRELLEKKWLQVWQIFHNEIEYCYTYVINETQGQRSMQRDDTTINISCNSRYLERQYTMMRKGVDWIGDCAIEKCTLQKYKHVLDVIEERGKMFNTHSTVGTQQ